MASVERVGKSNSLASLRGLNAAGKPWKLFVPLTGARIDRHGQFKAGTHASDKTTDLPAWNRAANNLVCVCTYSRLTTKGCRNSPFGVQLLILMANYVPTWPSNGKACSSTPLPRRPRIAFQSLTYLIVEPPCRFNLIL